MVVITFWSDDPELLTTLRELWAQLDTDTAAADKFCALLQGQVAQAVFGQPEVIH